MTYKCMHAESIEIFILGVVFEDLRLNMICKGMKRERVKDEISGLSLAGILCVNASKTKRNSRDT